MLVFFLLNSYAFVATAQEVADIEFKGISLHIAVVLTTEEDHDALQFRLRDNVSRKDVAISPCTYKLKMLNQNVSKNVDPKFRREFFEAFMTSRIFSVSVETFYNEFRVLLSQTRSDCPIAPLDALKDELRSKAG